jgi:hypothetical protein
MGRLGLALAQLRGHPAGGLLEGLQSLLQAVQFLVRKETLNANQRQRRVAVYLCQMPEVSRGVVFAFLGHQGLPLGLRYSVSKRSFLFFVELFHLNKYQLRD